jgi:integrase
VAYAYQKKNKAGKKAGPWYIGFAGPELDAHGKPKSVQQKTACHTKKEAETLAFELERKAERQRRGLEKAPVARRKFEDVARTYLATAAKAQASYDTIRQRVVDHILPTLGAKWVDEVTPADIERLLAQKEEEGYAPQTREHLRVHLLAIFTFAIEREKALQGDNPAALVPEVQVPDKEVRHVPEEYVSAIIAAVHERSRALFATAVYTGLRKGELFALPKTAYDTHRRLLTVATSHGRKTTKGGKVRYAPVPLELVPYLATQLARPEVRKSEYLFPDTAGGRRGAKEDLAGLFKSALRRAGLVAKYIHKCRRCGYVEEHQQDVAPVKCPSCGKMKLWVSTAALDFTFKDLRSTYGTYAAERTSDIRFVQATLGHGDVKVTEKHYAKVRAARLVEQGDKLTFGTYPALTTFPAGTASAPPSREEFEAIPGVTAARSRGLEPLTSGVTGRTTSVEGASPEAPNVGGTSTSLDESEDEGERKLPAPTSATYPALTDILTVAEVAGALTLSVSAVYALISGGQLAAVRRGPRLFVTAAALEAFIATSRP